MSKSFAQHLAEDRRLAILRILEGSAEYRANLYLIQRLLADIGHSAALDTINTDLAWLAEQGLLELETVGGVGIPQLLSRGLDVACGRAIVPGVARPMPD
ncbi:MAG: VpaChn25_0724 family phage protein [Thiobacillus sp.]